MQAQEGGHQHDESRPQDTALPSAERLQAEAETSAERRCEVKDDSQRFALIGCFLQCVR